MRKNYYIAANKIKIDAHWNSFNSEAEAKNYYKNHMNSIIGYKYSVVKETTETIFDLSKIR